MKSFVKRPSVAKTSLVFIKNMQKQPFVNVLQNRCS